MRKRLKTSLLILCAVFLLTALSGSIKPDKAKIFHLVTHHHDLLTDCIESGDYSRAKLFLTIKDVSQRNQTVDFLCDGWGLGSQTEYEGFFYSPDDDITALWAIPEDIEVLSPYGSGYLWDEAEGDNRCYIEHIVGHFYYYEASF